MQSFGWLTIVAAGLLAGSACGDDAGTEDGPNSEVGGDASVPGGRLGSDAPRSPADDAGSPTRSSDAGAGVADTGFPPNNVGGGDAVIVKSGTHGWNELRGAMLGDGSARPALLRKPLTVAVEGDAAGYMTGSAFATRSSLDSTYVTLFVLLHNQGSALRCFVKAPSVVWKSADGQVLHTTDGSYVTGSNFARRDADIVTNTCLAPGETGYLIEFESPDKGELPYFDNLTAVSLTLSDSNAQAYAPPAFMAVPQSYTAVGELLTVTFANVGTAPAPVDSGSLIEYIFLDDEGLPLEFGYLNANVSGDVPPNGTFSASDTYFFDGAARRLLVNMSY